MIGLDVKNADKIAGVLNKLPTKVEKKIVKQATRAVMKPVLSKVREAARAMSSGGQMGPAIAKGLVLRVAKKRRGLWGIDVRFKPRPQIPQLLHRTQTGKTYFIPHAIEYGHTTPGGRFVPPNSFIRVTWDRMRSGVQRGWYRMVTRGIMREWNKANVT